ncbi:hypothetical protein D3C71_1213750 [compost metagenome]
MAVERASLAIHQRAIIVQPRERAIEQRLVGRPADVAVVQPEQGQPGTVGGHQAAIAEAQHAFARGTEQAGVVMQADHLAIAQSRLEVAVFDMRYRLPCQHSGVQVLLARVAGDVEHADALPVGIEDRRRRTGQDRVRGEVVLAATHLHRAAFDDGGADRIGAHRGFIPTHAGHQCHPSGLVEETRVALRIQDPAGFVGQQRDAAGRRDVGRQAVQLRPRQPPQRFLALAQLAQACVRQRLDLRLCIHREPAALAALPRLQDGVGHDADRRRAALEKGASRIADTVLERELGHLDSPVSQSATVVAGPVPINTTPGVTAQ